MTGLSETSYLSSLTLYLPDQELFQGAAYDLEMKMVFVTGLTLKASG